MLRKAAVMTTVAMVTTKTHPARGWRRPPLEATIGTNIAASAIEPTAICTARTRASPSCAGRRDLEQARHFHRSRREAAAGRQSARQRRVELDGDLRARHLHAEI